MKLLVFALTPPPHHGQSYMVKLMLDGFGGDQRQGGTAGDPGLVQCYHVNARFASGPDDMGTFRMGKGIQLLRYALEALWCRIRHGVNVLYYIPAMPMKAPVIRDVVLLTLLRPFFSKTVFHWHAAGLGAWLESDEACPVLARLARVVLHKADLAITPAEFNLPDARKFAPRISLSVPNGIPDPCPEFEGTVAPRRLERARLFRAAQRGEVESAPVVQLLFMALCTEDKGLLDAVAALSILKNEAAAGGARLRYHLNVAGKFLNREEETKFREKVKALGLEKDVSCLGFLSGEEKKRVMMESDLFCFPTYYSAESFGLVLVEAMACGLPIVTTRWRSIPEFFPPGYPGLADVQQPEQLARSVRAVLQEDHADIFRRIYLDNYSAPKHLRQMTNALMKIA